MSLLKDDREQYVVGGIVSAISKAIGKKIPKSKLKKDLSQPTNKDFENVSREEILDYIETLPLNERLDLYGSNSPLKGKFEILDSDKIDFYEDVVNFNKLPDDYKSGDNSLLKAYLKKNDIPEKYMGDFDSAGEFKNVPFFKELESGKIQITIPPSTSMGKKKTKTFTNPTKKQIDDFFKQRERKNMGGLLQDDDERYGMKDGGPGIEALRKEAPEVVERMGYQEGGEIDNQMLMVMTPTQEPNMESEMPMESDDDMEDGYTRFIMEEALSEEEEDMLMSKLEQDEELSMLFDKVIDVAQEFAGSGPVNGPGSGVSDSIPARLSDGEFVFTAKAVEEIGEDTLMSMMKDAEAAADERQGLAEGGMPEDNNVNVQADALLGMDMTPDPTQEAINENMIKYQPYVRS